MSVQAVEPSPGADGTGRARRSRAREVLSWVVATAVGLLVLEGAAHMLQLGNHLFLVPTRSNCLRRSASLGTEFRPSCATAWPTGDRDTEFRTNSLALRDSEIEDDGAERILSIGDSCTWGWQVAQEDAYPQVLQRLLDEKAGPGRYRVINAGTPGYSSQQGVVYLRERGLALRPAIVIFGYAFNDAVRDGDLEGALALQRRILPLIEFDDLLLQYSRLWRAMRAATLPATNPALRVSPEKFRRNLTEIVRLTRDHGAKPQMIDFSGPGNDGAYTRVMADLSEELALPTVVYRGPKIDIVHPTREGYVELAEAILDRLEVDRYVRMRRAAD